MGQVGSDLASSFRLSVTDELRLYGAILLALLAYGLWVGVTGAALNFLADAIDVPLTPQPWTTTKTVLIGVAAVAWVLAPSLLGVVLLVDHLTNTSDNLAQQYRYRHPTAMLAPPLLLLGIVAGVGTSLDTVHWGVYVGLVAATVLLVVRVLAYSYRVFSLSYPRLLQGVVLVTAPLLALSLLTGGAIVLGREAYLAGIAGGFGGALGADSLPVFLFGSTTLVGIPMPTVVAATVVVPLALSTLYLIAQVVSGQAARLLEPDVRRSDLRTGQRYPAFASPATGQTSTSPPTASATDGSGDDAGIDGATTSSTTASSSSSGTTSGPGASDASTDTTSTGAASSSSSTDREETDDVSNTRVYTPPGGGFGESDDSGEDADEESTTSTRVFDRETCPACGETHDPDEDFCPSCGESLG